MELMARRRMLLSMAHGGLPGAYQAVDWINIPRDAYLDTGYIPTVAPKIVSRLNTNTGTDADIFGFSTLIAPMFTVNPSGAGTNWYNRWGATTATQFHSIVSTPTDCVFGKTTIIGEVVYTDAFPDVDWSGNVQTVRVGGGRTLASDVTIYTFQLYDGTYLARNLIPCVRISDSEPGMYDTVSRTFYINAGSYHFVIPT